ncbi:MAG TPA: hypothetical protein VFH95_12480 [Candidatus Kapabacteria bacterium]|nr:hypothetical protein [Candidatus Kapabacteria bacterium]
MAQVDNLKLLHGNIRKYFEEVTFTRQARITDKAFKFLTLYTFTIAVVPSFVKTVLDFSTQVAGGCCGVIWISIIGLLSLASIALFIISVVFMLQVMHVRYHSAFDFSDPLETVWNDPGLPDELLLYSVSKKLIEAANDNLPVDDQRSQRMKLSYTLFYTCVGMGLTLFVALRLYLYFYHA